VRVSSLAPLTVLLGLAAARADDGKALAPFLDDRAVAVLRLDLAGADVGRLVERLAAAAGLKAASPAEATKEWSALAGGLVKDGAGVTYAVVSLADEEPFLVLPLGKGADPAKLTKRLAGLKRLAGSLEVARLGPALVVATPAVQARLRKLKPTPRPDVLAALGPGGGPHRAGGRQPPFDKEAPLARLAVVPTTDARRVLEETLPTLPEELGGGSVRPLSRGLRWLTLDLSAAPKLGARLTVQAADADSARALDALAGGVLKLLSGIKEVAAAVPEVRRLPGLWKPKREGDRLVLALDEKELGGVLRPYVERLIVTERQARAAAQMRLLLRAMIGYERKHGTFPAHASYDKEVKPLLSWRVHLLPFLGEEKLYKEFRLGEPWDSPHNRKLLARMPAAYRPAEDKLAGRWRTTYLAPLGEQTMFPGPRGVRVAEVADGTADTALLVDAADERAVEWTRPADLAVEEKDPRRGLAARHGGQVLLGMADGGVRFLPGSVPARTLWGLFTRAGGEVLDLP
jgi:hypothetical protein